ncbi:hypothetical protein, partial [Niallia sp. 03190]|uniref:hypothetical protein n=1 Tax=Niallia sp. 03190 TaxID=3458061 RepID=UPI004044EB01
RSLRVFSLLSTSSPIFLRKNQQTLRKQPKVKCTFGDKRTLFFGADQGASAFLFPIYFDNFSIHFPGKVTNLQIPFCFIKIVAILV